MPRVKNFVGQYIAHSVNKYGQYIGSHMNNIREIYDSSVWAHSGHTVSHIIPILVAYYFPEINKCIIY